MRREKPKEKNIFSVSNAFLFLWWKCESCKEQVRLETVWSFTLFNKNAYAANISGVAQQRVMVCKECCPTKGKADDFAKSFNEGGNEFHEFTDSSGTPMPKGKAPKPEGPRNIVFTDASLLDEILPTKPWPRE